MKQYAPGYNPKAIGEKSEGMILSALLRAGKVVLQPFGDNQRYDLVVDEGEGRFVRIQCKTARLKKDGSVLEFETFSSSGSGSLNKRGYKGQIEMFAVYSPELDKIYMIPVEELGETGASLRIKPTANGQKKGSRFASQFEFPFLRSSVEERPAVRNGSLVE